MKGMLPKVGWGIVGLALLVSLWLDYANVVQGGAIDLRNRITGARVLENHIDPYHYKWHRPEPEEYCDLYNNPNLKVSKTTATPALLALHVPLASLNYGTGQWIWFALQWLLLLGTAWLWLRRCTTDTQRWLLAILIAGFTFTAAWRLHAERGQSYVLLLFLFSLWLTITLDSKRGNGFVAGLIAGLLIALRPPFLLLVPFLALHRRGQLAGTTLGLLFSVALPMIWLPHGWIDYVSGMQDQSEIYRTDYAPHGVMAWPRIIEGISTEKVLGVFVPIPYADFSAHAFLKWLDLEPIPALPVLLAAAIPFCFWLWLTQKTSGDKLLAGLAAWLFLVDLFLPAYRNNYNDVVALSFIALAIIRSPRPHWALGPCLLALPVGIWIYLAQPDEKWLINLPSLLFTIAALLLLFPQPSFTEASPISNDRPRRKKR